MREYPLYWTPTSKIRAEIRTELGGRDGAAPPSGPEARRVKTRREIREAIAALAVSRMDATNEGVRQAHSEAARALEVLYRLLAPALETPTREAA